MADVIITYDVDSKHVEVKARMKALGYIDSVAGTAGTTYLPNTTLWRPSTTPQTAVEHLQGTCAALRVHLQRALADIFTAEWRGIVGAPHST
jgi:hypothetical protein